MLVDVVHVISSQLRELFFVLNDDIVAGDKVKAPCTQLRGIVELRGQKETWKIHKCELEHIRTFPRSY